MKLYLACGRDRIEGYHHVDINPACAPDQVFDLLDLSRRWPWNNVSDIQLKHFCEHIPHGDGGKDHFIRFFERCWHILRDGGTMTIRFPWYASIGAFSDPTHQRVITPLTFYYLSKAWLRDRKIDHYDQVCDFDVSVVAETNDNFTPEQRELAINQLWNISHEGVATLKAIK